MLNNVSVVRALTSNEPRESGFIGRQPELAVLTSALDDALSGRGQMVMLAGEPGIGKTRLAQELATRAESLGAQVMWGGCYEHVGAPPYWPYVQPIRAYVQEISAEQLRSQMGPGAADIADVISEVLTKLPDLEMPAALDPDQAEIAARCSVRDIALVDQRRRDATPGEAVGHRRTDQAAADHHGLEPVHGCFLRHLSV